MYLLLGALSDLQIVGCLQWVVASGAVVRRAMRPVSESSFQVMVDR